MPATNPPLGPPPPRPGENWPLNGLGESKELGRALPREPPRPLKGCPLITLWGAVSPVAGIEGAPGPPPRLAPRPRPRPRFLPCPLKVLGGVMGVLTWGICAALLWETLAMDEASLIEAVTTGLIAVLGCLSRTPLRPAPRPRLPDGCPLKMVGSLAIGPGICAGIWECPEGMLWEMLGLVMVAVSGSITWIVVVVALASGGLPGASAWLEPRPRPRPRTWLPPPNPPIALGISTCGVSEISGVALVSMLEGPPNWLPRLSPPGWPPREV